MISTTQATAYIEQMLGAAPPAFVITAACEDVEALESAMADAGYSEAKQTMVQCMAVALIACAGSPRRLSSQAAPSGASRSFKYDPKDLTALRHSLAAADAAGIVAELVGPDPAAATMLLVLGGC